MAVFKIEVVSMQPEQPPVAAAKLAPPHSVLVALLPELIWQVR